MEKEMFEEIKRCCLSVWENYKDRPGDYYKSKVDYVKRITNPKDYYVLINMFDLENQRKLYNKLSLETRDYCMEEFTHMKEYYNI